MDVATVAFSFGSELSRDWTLIGSDATREMKKGGTTLLAFQTILLSRYTQQALKWH